VQLRGRFRAGEDELLDLEELVGSKDSLLIDPVPADLLAEVVAEPDEPDR